MEPVVSPRYLHSIRPGFLSAVLLQLFVLLTLAGVLAQAPTKVFVASTGNDANDGSRGSPKRNFQHAE